MPEHNLHNRLTLLSQRALDPLNVRVVNLAPTRVRGIDPYRDLACLLDQKADPIVFDVGANDGETVTDFLQRFPEARVVAFEPFRPCFDLLERRFHGNPHVRLRNTALGAARDCRQLNVYSGNRMNSLLELDATPGNMMAKKFMQTGAVEVVIDTLDAFCREHGFTTIDILKIDTQGYDLEVLRGAGEMLNARQVKTVLLEVNFVPMYRNQSSFPELHAFLSGMGYRLVDFYNQERRNGCIAWCDACYAASDLTDANKR